MNYCNTYSKKKSITLNSLKYNYFINLKIYIYEKCIYFVSLDIDRAVKFFEKIFVQCSVTVK